jgi:hypothetical protein
MPINETKENAMTMLDSFLYMFFSAISSIALLIVLNLLLPGKVQRVREKLEGHYIRSFVVGLIALGFSLGILLLLSYLFSLPTYGRGLMADERRPMTNIIIVEHMLIPGILALLVIVIAIILVSISAIGLATLANSLGQRIGNSRPSLNPNLIGATLVVLSGLAPFLGWFIFAPVALCISFGSTVQTLFQRKATPKVVKQIFIP